jgi:hypothetical protein
MGACMVAYMAACVVVCIVVCMVVLWWRYGGVYGVACMRTRACE